MHSSGTLKCIPEVLLFRNEKQEQFFQCQWLTMIKKYTANAFFWTSNWASGWNTDAVGVDKKTPINHSFIA